jgi:hypothetical protein
MVIYLATFDRVVRQNVSEGGSQKGLLNRGLNNKTVLNMQRPGENVFKQREYGVQSY